MSDPTWLPDVLRKAGLRCDIFPGAFDRGHGDFGEIWGPFMHHTGSFGETPNGIANHPTLGLASQLYLRKDGVYTLCGVGVAWHAGTGSWPGIPTNNGNQVCIGIEAAHDGRSPWPAPMYDAYLRGVRAINQHLGNPLDKVVAHKEYGAIQGKWDPGNLDMARFRQQLRTVGAPAPVTNMINLDASENPWVGRRLMTGELAVGRDGRGRMVAFEHAHIYWSVGTGAHAIPHAAAGLADTGLFEAYAARSFERGELGYPVRDFTKLDHGAVQAFQGGVLYRRDGEPGFVVKGVIGQRWAREGYEKGPLGWPTSDEVPNGTGGRLQTFEHGALEWDPTGAVKEIGSAATDLTQVNHVGEPLALDAVKIAA